MRSAVHFSFKVKLFGGIGPLNPSLMGRDALAGISLAAMCIPQLLGYAQIAGMPLAAGLYTALLAPLAFALFASSRYLVVAADSATAALLAGGLAAMAAPGSPAYVGIVASCTLLTAVLLLVARLLKLGFLADFLSRTVLVGFLTGVGLQVGIAMLAEMLRIDAPAHNTLVQAWQILHGLSHLSLPSLGLALGVVGVILASQAWRPRLPTALVLLVLSILAGRWLDLGDHGFALLGPLRGGLPRFAWPDLDWTELSTLLPVSAGCVVVILAQSAATARAFAQRHGEQEDGNADLLGLAAANVLTALGGGFIANGSPTQTAVADRAGARSQVAQIVFSASVLVVLLFLAGWLRFLPRAVLAAVIFTIALSLIDIATLRAMRRESPGEWWLALTTAAAVTALGVEQGMVISVVLSLLRHVRHSYRPHSALLRRVPHAGWQEEAAEPGQQSAPGVLIYRFNADLFYANAEHFAAELRALVASAPDPVRYLVIEADAISHVDYSAARTVMGLLDAMDAAAVQVIFARAAPGLQADLARHHLLERIGPDHVFATRHDALKHVEERGGAKTAANEPSST